MHPALLRFLAWPRREEGAYPLARPPACSRYSPPPPRRSVTDEQRRPGQKAEQPFGPRWRKGLEGAGGWASRERFGASGGVARSLQTTEEAEGNSGCRRVGEQAGMRVARALPSAPKRSRAGCMGISTDSKRTFERRVVIPSRSLRPASADPSSSKTATSRRETRPRSDKTRAPGTNRYR